MTLLAVANDFFITNDIEYDPVHLFKDVSVSLPPRLWWYTLCFYFCPHTETHTDAVHCTVFTDCDSSAGDLGICWAQLQAHRGLSWAEQRTTATSCSGGQVSNYVARLSAELGRLLWNIRSYRWPWMTYLVTKYNQYLNNYIKIMLLLRWCWWCRHFTTQIIM